jgi:hypothetical protein
MNSDCYKAPGNEEERLLVLCQKLRVLFHSFVHCVTQELFCPLAVLFGEVVPPEHRAESQAGMVGFEHLTDSGVAGVIPFVGRFFQIV